MNRDRFDFEQSIIKSWNIIDDLKEMSSFFLEGKIDNDPDTIHNYLFGLANVYDIKFNQLWEDFEQVMMQLVRENTLLNEECAALRKDILEIQYKESK